jgi:hypothetical protein
MTDDRAGIEMTQAILRAVAPIVDGQPSELVMEAFAAALAAALAGSGSDKKGARLVLHRYAERILDFAEMI